MIRIDVLPDDVLLETFDFYMVLSTSSGYGETAIEEWQLLVHVCRRWRYLVFGSPRRLNLRLLCTLERPTKDTLDIWPALPLVVDSEGIMDLSLNTDNITTALGQNNRVCKVKLRLGNRQLEEVLAAMRVSFPELIRIHLVLDKGTPPVIPDSFLGGSAPRLRNFELEGIPFPGLPKLLLSATHLVELSLLNVPHSGYISPKAMVALLSALSSLKELALGFESLQSRPDREIRSLPPPIRSILPALREFYFAGVTEYLEEFVTRIDAPQLVEMHMKFYNQIGFDGQRLAEFIHQTPTLRAHNEAYVQFGDYYASIELRSWPKVLEIGTLYVEPDLQLLFLSQVHNSPLPPPSTVENLYIRRDFGCLEPVWKNDIIEKTQWSQLLLPFTAVKNLYLTNEFAPLVGAALQDLIGDKMVEVLPNLENIFVERLEPFQENFGQFVARRQLSDHPIAISVCTRATFWD